MSRMYNQGVPKKLIADKSDHRSLDGLRVYEHPSSDMENVAGDVISDPTKSFQEAKQERQPEVKPEQEAGTATSHPTESFQEAKQERHPEVKQEQQPQVEQDKVIQPQLPACSGLTNCNITFNINYGKKD